MTFLLRKHFVTLPLITLAFSFGASAMNQGKQVESRQIVDQRKTPKIPMSACDVVKYDGEVEIDRHHVDIEDTTVVRERNYTEHKSWDTEEVREECPKIGKIPAVGKNERNWKEVVSKDGSRVRVSEPICSRMEGQKKQKIIRHYDQDTQVKEVVTDTEETIREYDDCTETHRVPAPASCKSNKQTSNCQSNKQN